MGKRVWSRQGELSDLSSTPAEGPLFVGVRPAADQVTGWRIRTGNWPVQILTEKYHIGQVHTTLQLFSRSMQRIFLLLAAHPSRRGWAWMR